MADSRLSDMFAKAVHIGSQASHWSPRMRDFIFSTQNGVHVFDLNQTAKHLDDMTAKLKDFCSQGGELIIVGSKMQSQAIARKLAEDTGHHFVISTWVPGLLTNFSTIKKRIKEYNKLLDDIKTREIDNLSKKEKAMAMVIFERLHKRYEGVKDMKRLPDGILVLDGHYDRLSVAEANKVGIPVFAFLGTTGNPADCDYFIPGNVNTVKSIQYLVDAVSPVLKRQERKGKGRIRLEGEEAPEKKEAPKSEAKPAAKPAAKKEEAKEPAKKPSGKTATAAKKAPAKKPAAKPAAKKAPAKKPAAKKPTAKKTETK